MVPSENQRARAYTLTAAGRRRLNAETADWRQFSVPIRRLLDSLWRDVRFALRMLRRGPGFAAVALLSLNVGIGFNTALFTLVDALLLRPLPVERADRLVDVFTSLREDFPYFTSLVLLALVRLEAKGYVCSIIGPPTPERGGRAKRLFRIEADGERALRASQEAIRRMTVGLRNRWRST